MTICIIPARSGSKRIKNKNIKIFFGKPLIYYSIKLAIKSKIFDQIIVSTDSEKIKKIALKFGASVPFLRSKKNSDDNTPINDVLLEVIKKLNIKDQYIFCIYPTAPLLKVNHLKIAYKKINNKYDQIVAITKYTSPIQRALKKTKKNMLKFLYPKFKFYRSQDLENMYYDSGTFAVYKCSKLFNYRKNQNLKIGYVEIDKYSSVDINNQDDLNFAKKLYRIINDVK